MKSILKELISIPKEKASKKDDENLVKELKKSQLIMPIEIDSKRKNNKSENVFRFKPVKISDEHDNHFIALFSDEDELVKADVEFNVINIRSENLAEMIKESTDEYFGIAINPFSDYSLAIPLAEFLELFET